MKKLLREDVKQVLRDLKNNHPEEFELYKQLVAQASNVNETTSKELLDKIVKGWRNYSIAFLTAMTMTPALARDLKDYSPKTFNDIAKEITVDKSQQTQSITSAMKPLPGQVVSFDFGENFASGEVTLTNKQSLVSSIEAIKQWCKGKKLKNFKVVITASESQVTNPKGYEEPESLARARAEVIYKLVDKLKLGFNKIEIDTQRGKIPYKSGVDNPDDQKYTNEQFVTVSIVVENSVCSMAPFTESGNQGTHEEYISGKGNLEIHTGTIPDRLVILDAKGKITYDTGYVATDKTNSQSGYEEWEYVPIYILKLTELASNKNVMGSKVKYLDMSGVKTFEDLKNKMLKQPGKPTTKSDTVDSALQQLEAMFNSGVRKFVAYEVGTGDLKIPFDENRGDVKVKVISPVGKTGFSITGQCTN